MMYYVEPSMMDVMHHGKKGMKWGIRNGPPYPIGKKNKTVFISGSSKTQFKDSEYYRGQLPREVKKTIDKYIEDGKKIIVGDAPGIDRQVQNYLKSKRYSNVEIYGPGTKVRYNANKKWKTNPIDAPEFEVGSKDWLAKKDIAMTKAANEMLAIILDEGSEATRRNVRIAINKYKNTSIKVYEINKRKNKKLDRWIDDLLNI